MFDHTELWQFLIVGYLITISIETPVLLIGLSKVHSMKMRLAAGVWLTACSYPIVVVVLPIFMREASRFNYLLVAEIFAPVSECILFYLAFYPSNEEQTNSLKDKQAGGYSRRTLCRDWTAIVVANILSFLPIELLRVYGVINW